MSEYDEFRREDEERDRQHAAREARERLDLAEARMELAEFRGRECFACQEDDTRTVACGHIAQPIAAAIDGWLASQRTGRRAA
jgi:hypothetical protein